MIAYTFISKDSISSLYNITYMILGNTVLYKLIIHWYALLWEGNFLNS